MSFNINNNNNSQFVHSEAPKRGDHTLKKKKQPDKMLTLVKTRMSKIANFNGHSITLGLMTTVNSTNKNQDNPV